MNWIINFIYFKNLKVRNSEEFFLIRFKSIYSYKGDSLKGLHNL